MHGCYLRCTIPAAAIPLLKNDQLATLKDISDLLDVKLLALKEDFKKEMKKFKEDINANIATQIHPLLQYKKMLNKRNKM